MKLKLIGQKLYLKMLTLFLLLATTIFAQDSNFHIYICFGQSNMEGQGTIETQDETVDSRFQVMAAVDCSNLGREMGNWYTAVPPLCRCYSGLCPADYFGRTMVENLPDSIKVGVINVSVAGCKIELFDKDNYEDYASTVADWMKNIIAAYGGSPYGRLVEIAQLAQQDGVIKGILLHQGESNTGESQWPAKVKVVYDNLINDLGLDADSVPLLAGELVNADQGGSCASMNSIIAKLPQTIPNSYIISSAGCTDESDNIHFNSAGYRKLGTRYAEQMLSILGYEKEEQDTTGWVGTWSTAPYAAANNTPPAPYLANNTLRQIVRTSIGGDTLRIKFSNRTCSTPVTMNSVNIAVSNDPGTSVIDTSTIEQLTFSGNTSVTMAAYSEVTSDAIAFPLTPAMKLAITIHYGDVENSSDMTFHYGSRTDAYILEGDQTTSGDFAGATTVERWYHLSSIEVLASPKSAAVAVLGNSITDGYGVHGGPNNRWTQFFSDELLENEETSHVSVLNLGIGGTLVTTSGLSRFQKDVLDQSGLRWIIVFYGVNDIGANKSASDIIGAFETMISEAHAQNIRIYGATITPFKGHSYYTTAHEAVRQEVNEWIRTSGNFDKCIDFDEILRDPSDTEKMQAAYSNDWLHPSAAGYQFLGESVDLDLFLGEDTTFEEEEEPEKSYYYEPECGTVGENWNIVDDEEASNGNYVTVQSGVESLDAASNEEAALITLPFSVDSTGTWYIYGRLNCATYDDDSFWIKVDDGNFEMYNGLVTSGWEWMSLGSSSLTAGDHTLTICYREDGAEMDKICISNKANTPEGMGDEAENLCEPNSIDNSLNTPLEFKLNLNYPNPFNPSTNIRYTLPRSEKVKLSVYNIKGDLVKTLVNKEQTAGEHSIVFSSENLPSGIYLYKLATSHNTETRRMLLLK